MPDERPGDGHCAPEVFVVTDEGGDDFAGVVEAEGAQDHRETEGDEAEAPDAADDVFAEEVVVLLLGAAVVVVEGALLAGGSGKTPVPAASPGAGRVRGSRSRCRRRFLPGWCCWCGRKRQSIPGGS